MLPAAAPSMGAGGGGGKSFFRIPGNGTGQTFAVDRFTQPAPYATIATVMFAGWLLFPALVYAQAVTVTGTVTNAITQAPIAGVTVRVFGSNDIQELSTDANGVFRAEGLENCCRVLFDKEGFEAVGPSNLKFQAAVNPVPLNLKMRPWPVLRGRVLDPERHPIRGCTVEAIDRLGGRKTATSGADGAYSFEHNLSPGEYILLATPSTRRATESTELAPTYFPDATEPERALTLELAAAGEMSGYDISVRQVPVFRVAGRVVDETGAPAAGAIVQVATATATATADDNGRFELANVRPGNAVMQADWPRGETALRGFSAIALCDRGLDNLMLRVTPPVPVAGMVELDAKPVQVDGTASLRPIDGDGSPAEAPIGPAGLHFAAVYPGRYRLQVWVNSGFVRRHYLDSVWLGERDITTDEFEVAPGLAPLRVRLKSGGGRVSGTVRDGDGGIIVLVPKDDRQRLPAFVATAFFQGSLFQVENVRPGDYYAVAVKGTFNHRWMSDPVHGARLLSGARTVQVGDTGTVTVTIDYVNAAATR